MINRFHKGIAAAVLLSLATINYLSTSNSIVTLVEVPLNGDLDEMADPIDPDLSRRLAHNTRGLDLDPNSARYKRILQRRTKFRIAMKELRKERRIQLNVLRKKQKNIHFRWNQEQRKEVRSLEFSTDSPEDEELVDLNPQTICDRPTDLGTARDFSLLQQSSRKSCPGTSSPDNNSILLLEGLKTFGRTGNNLIEFLHALQYARDKDVQVGIMSGSWAMQVLLKMWMAIQEDNEENWIHRFEDAFCVKIFKTEEELEGWNVIRKETRDLFVYKSQTPLHEYMAAQGDSIRTLWNAYNTGDGVDGNGGDVMNMCSAIDSMFGDDRSGAIYSVIHSRALEGEPGLILLGNVSRKSGCDPTAALDMKPDYIKSILRPLGMLKYPIVFITDGQNEKVLSRLVADPDIGPLIRLVPQEASWVGGDITLAIMSNVFIGNPASTFSGFIAKSRLSMGFGHNYLFRAKNDKGGWATVCGDDCIFDRSIMASMY